MTEEKNTSLHPISEALRELYQVLVDKGQVSFGFHAEQMRKLDSVVKTVNAQYWGVEPYPTAEDKAAAYFVFLIKDHPFTDGNKRMAVFFLEVFCSVSGLVLSLPPDTALDQIAVSVEKGGEAHLMVPDVKRVLFGKDAS